MRITFANRIVILVNGNVSREAESLSQGSNHTLRDQAVSDNTMSVEKLDNVVAAITLAATVVTITLGFILNL